MRTERPWIGHPSHSVTFKACQIAARPLHGFGSAGVLEVVEDWRGNTYRAIYAVRLSAAVFVLHVFQKKAKRGIATPKLEMELIRERLKVAGRIAKELPR